MDDEGTLVWDLLRIGTIAAWGFGAVLAGFVFFEYLRKWRREGGLLPKHVFRIAAAYQLLGAGIVIIILERLDEASLHAATVLGGIAFPLGDSALWVLYRHVTKREGKVRRRAADAH